MSQITAGERSSQIVLPPDLTIPYIGLHSNVGDVDGAAQVSGINLGR